MSNRSGRDDVTRVLDGSGATRAGNAGETGSAPPPAEPSSLGVPRDPQGRYAVLEEIGRGAMGVVLRAYDPKLQREVALKVVRVRSANAETRLVREARAMAQLSHPNVVAVFDVAGGEELLGGPLAPKTHAGTIVVAMEYVPGVTLSAWCDAETRATAEVVDAFCAAGRGLAAAHREGLLHRDFKPDNVLVGNDGRVRVTDFGLVQADTGHESHGFVEDDAVDSGLDHGDVLTRAGTVMGTPRYMAPEQHSVGRLTPAADQYAFCVSLWEALAGAPPFQGDIVELAQAKQGGAPAWPRGRSAPTRVIDALRRGLSPHPSDRFEDMDRMLAALARPARAPGPMAATAVLAVVVAAAAVGGVGDAPAPDPLCTGSSDRLTGVWDPARSATVRAGFVEGNPPYVEALWERIAPRLDGWASAWAQMHRETCMATRVRGEQSEAVMDLRMACLGRTLQQLDAAVQVLADPTAEALERAHEVVGGLPALEQCADIDALTAAVPPPEPSEVEAVQDIRGELAVAAARRHAGDFVPAEAAVQRAEAASRTIGYAPVVTELLLENGAVLAALGRYDEAEAALRKTRQQGARWGQWDEVRAATIRLVRVLGYHGAKHGEALALRELALGLSSGPEQEAWARGTLALVLGKQGQYDEAEKEQRAVLALRMAALGPEHPDVANTRNSLGTMLYEQGRYEAAAVEYEAAQTLRSAALGKDHPSVANTRNNLALVLQAQGKYDQALAEHRAVLSLRTASFGPDHPHVAASHNNVGMVLQRSGDLPGAEAEYARARQLWTTALGPDHINVGAARHNLGAVMAAQGRNKEAEAELRAAIGVRTRAYGPQHPGVASGRHNLAIVLRSMGKLEASEAEHRAVIELHTTALGAEHPQVAAARNNLGNLLLERGKLAAAEQEHRAALAVRERVLGTAEPHPDIATSHLNLAEVLRAARKDKEAEAEYREGLALRSAALGPEHPEVANALDALGSLLAERGDRPQAEAMRRRAKQNRASAKAATAAQ